MANHTTPQSAPGLPTIQDEAAATPMWVPTLGLGLFMLLALWMIVSSVLAEAEEDIAQDDAPVAEATP